MSNVQFQHLLQVLLGVGEQVDGDEGVDSVHRRYFFGLCDSNYQIDQTCIHEFVLKVSMIHSEVSTKNRNFFEDLHSQLVILL